MSTLLRNESPPQLSWIHSLNLRDLCEIEVCSGTTVSQFWNLPAPVNCTFPHMTAKLPDIQSPAVKNVSSVLPRLFYDINREKQVSCITSRNPLLRTSPTLLSL